MTSNDTEVSRPTLRFKAFHDDAANGCGLYYKKSILGVVYMMTIAREHNKLFGNTLLDADVIRMT